MDICQRHAAAGLTHPHRKQKFGEMEGGPTTETDSNTSTNDKAAAAHADPNTITLDVQEIMEDLIEAVNNENAEDDPLPTIPNPLPAHILTLVGLIHP